MNFRQITNEEFNAFIDNFQLKTPYQTVPYALTMTNEGYDTLFVGIVDYNNVVKAASLILIKREETYKYAYAPRGFLIDYSDKELVNIFSTEIKKFLERINVSAIKINPMIVRNVYDIDHKLLYNNDSYDVLYDKFMSLGYMHLGYNNFFESLKPRFEAIIELNKSPFVLFKNMQKEFRTKVRSAERNGVRIYRGNEANIEELYENIKAKYPRGLQYLKNIYFNFNRENKIELYYAKLNTAAYLKEAQDDFITQEGICNEINERIMESNGNSSKLINRKIDADKVLESYREKLVTASNYLNTFPDGIILSTIMIIKIGRDAFVFMDGYNEKYKSFNAKHLLIWKLIEKYSKNNYLRFNLGGLSNIVDEKHKYIGLNDFKLSFGAYMYEYMGDLELITKKSIYTLFRKVMPIKDMSKSKLER